MKSNLNPQQKKSLRLLRKALKEMTPEETEKYFPKDTRPKGWLSIEDYLPMWMADDAAKGYSEYRVRLSDGTERTTRVADHNTWYYEAKYNGITHWLNK